MEITNLKEKLIFTKVNFINNKFNLELNSYEIKEKQNVPLPPSNPLAWYKSLPDGVYWISNLGKLKYVSNGVFSDPPDRQSNTCDVNGEIVECFSPKLIQNYASYLLDKGFINNTGTEVGSKLDTRYFEYVKKEIPTSLSETNNGYVNESVFSTQFRKLPFYEVYANIFKDGEIKEANMYAVNSNNLVSLYLDGFKVSEFKSSYLNKLSESAGFSRYEDKKNPFLLRGMKKMFTNNVDKFYALSDLALASGSKKGSYLIKTVQNGKYCTFNIDPTINSSFVISLVKNGIEYYGQNFIQQVGNEFFDIESWDYNVNFNNFLIEDMNKFSKRSYVFTTDDEKNFSKFVDKKLKNIFQDSNKRYFVHSKDINSQDLINYPKENFLYTDENDERCIFGKFGASKGLKYAEPLEALGNSEYSPETSSFFPEIKEGNITIASRYLPPLIDVTLSTGEKIKTRVGSTPTLHFNFKGLTLKPSLARGAYLSGYFYDGARGSCIWNEQGREDYKNIFKNENALKALRDIWLAYDNAGGNISNFSQGTYKIKDKEYLKADTLNGAAELRDKFITAYKKETNGCDWWDNLNLLPAKVNQRGDDPNLFYTFEPLTKMATNKASLYYYDSFLNRSGIVPFTSFSQTYHAKPSNGPFTVGLLKNGKRVDRKTFFGTSSVDSTLPMLSVNPSYAPPIDIFNGRRSKYQYRPFVSFTNAGDAILANGPFANGIFTEGSAFGGKTQVDKGFSLIKQAYDSSDEISDVVAFLNSSTPDKKESQIDQSNQSRNFTKTEDGLTESTLTKNINGRNQDKTKESPPLTVEQAIDGGAELYTSSINGIPTTEATIRGIYVYGLRITPKIVKLNPHLYVHRIFKISARVMNSLNNFDPPPNELKFITFDESGNCILANGFYCSSDKTPLKGEFPGGKFTNGIRDVNFTSSEFDYHTDLFYKTVFLVANGVANVIENRLLITPAGGPFWNLGIPEREHSIKTDIEPRLDLDTGDQIEFDGKKVFNIVNTEISIYNLFGLKVPQMRLFYIDSGDAINDVEYGIYYHDYWEDTGQITQGNGVDQSAGEHIYVRHSYEVSRDSATNRDKIEIRSGFSDTRTTPIIASTTSFFDNIPRFDSLVNGWLVGGAHSKHDINTGIILTEALNKKGNGFIPYLSKVKVVTFSGTSYKPILYSALFYDRGGEYVKARKADKLPEETHESQNGVYYLYGYAMPGPSDFDIESGSVATRFTSFKNLQNTGFLDKNGNGVLSLQALEAINYNWDDNQSKIKIIKTLAFWEMESIDKITIPRLPVFDKSAADYYNKKEAELEQMRQTAKFKQAYDHDLYVANKKAEIERKYPTLNKETVGIVTFLTLGSSSVNKDGSLKIIELSMKEVINSLNQIKIEYVKVDLNNKSKVDSSDSIIDLAKIYARKYYDQATNNPTSGRSEWVNKNYKSFIHIRMEKGIAVGLVIMDKWLNQFNKMSTITIEEKVETERGKYEPFWGSERLQDGNRKLQDFKEKFKDSAVPTEKRFWPIPNTKRKTGYNSTLKNSTIASVHSSVPFVNSVSPFSIDMLSPDSRDFLAYYDTNLDENGNGFSKDIYWVNYVPSTLDAQGNGFWMDSSFEGGQIV